MRILWKLCIIKRIKMILSFLSYVDVNIDWKVKELILNY